MFCTKLYALVCGVSTGVPAPALAEPPLAPLPPTRLKPPPPPPEPPALLLDSASCSLNCLICS